MPYDDPSSNDYELDVAPFNTRLPYEPVAITVATTEKHIQDAVACGASLGIKVTPKCGGHSYASLGLGGEDGHLVVEMDRMNGVEYREEDRVAVIQGGARLGHVAAELWEAAGRAMSHGTCPGYDICSQWSPNEKYSTLTGYAGWG